MKAARENFDSLSTKEKTLILADLRVESWSPPQIDSDSLKRQLLISQNGQNGTRGSATVGADPAWR